MKNAWGETHAAFDLLNSAISQNLPDPKTNPENAKVQSSLRIELAGIYVTRGDLDRALALYQESLQLEEQLGDKREIGGTLHRMAEVFLMHNELDRALEIYQENLKLYEQLGDHKAEAVSLYMMAAVYFQRGDLDDAIKLYEESLQLLEQVGDQQNKANVLGNMALVFELRGNFERALELHQESLRLSEQLGDIRGKAVSLSALSNVFIAKGDFQKAEEALQESLILRQQVGHLEGVAFSLGKLGQVAQKRGDKTTALARYQEALSILEKLGMPRESQQVRQMIADLQGDEVANNDPLAQVLAQAREASQRGDVQSTIQYQEQAVKLARGAGEGREVLVSLSVVLYNLAGFYQKAERYDDAVEAMEEVVAIDEQTGHQDLEFDRKTLEAFRRIASLTPEEREQLRQQAEEEQESPDEEDSFETQLQAQLAQLPLEKRAEAEAQIRKAYAEFQRMSS